MGTIVKVTYPLCIFKLVKTNGLFVAFGKWGYVFLNNEHNDFRSNKKWNKYATLAPFLKAV